MLELSADLRARQQQALEREVPGLASRVEWIEALPERPWQGIVLANELLDAMPVHRFRADGLSEVGGWQEAFVGWTGEALEQRFQALASLDLAAGLQTLNAELPWTLPDGYQSELNPAAAPWVSQVAGSLERGLVLLSDYGFPRNEFYHPERGMGTLMCHYRQRSHGDPLILPGLQDITAHVDFTAVGEAALAAGMRVAGYTRQAVFLGNNGLLEWAQSLPTGAGAAQARVTVNRDITLMTSPAEMWELFKVIALTHGIDGPLLGFVRGDRRAMLG
jgi:SAM-dependent MidA family methyltransferase